MAKKTREDKERAKLERHSKESTAKERRRKERVNIHSDASAEVVFNELSGRVYRVSTKIAGSIRFSMKLRIALAHVWLALRLLPLVAIVALAASIFTEARTFVRNRDDALIVAAQSKFDDAPISVEYGVTLAHLNIPDEVTPVDKTAPIDLTVRFGKGWGVTYDREQANVILVYQMGEWVVRQSPDEVYHDFFIYLYAFGFVWLVLIISILSRGTRRSAKLLAPVGHIADTARQLSEQNLSLRINVEGTQNELRYLATTINDMLDRIESAYNRQKQFVSDASHELRTPIAVLQGYANLLERWGKDAPEVRDEAITAIVSETQSMKVLVENLLFLARHDKHTLNLNVETFQIHDLLAEIVKDTELIAAGRNVKLTSDTSCSLSADRTAIKQAIRVLVENAIKYTADGGDIDISCECDGEACHISVKDSGIGIRKDDLPRIFDRFFRADEARESKTGGHGLGLSIARIIVASHGGTINVRSKLGEGSRFTINLPVGVR